MLSATAARRSHEAWFEDGDGERHRARCTPASARARSRAACASTRRVDGPGLRRRRCSDDRRRHGVRAPPTAAHGPRPGASRAGEEVAFRVALRQPARRPAATRDAGGGAPAAAATRGSTAASASRRSSSPATLAPSGIVDLPFDAASAARDAAPRRSSGEHLARRARAPRAARSRARSALGSDPRRFWHLTLDARGHRLQAALLRLRARLPVAAHAAAVAVRDPLPRLQRLPELQRRRAVLPGRAAARHRAVHVPRRLDRRRGAARSSTARTSCARSSSRGWPSRWRSVLHGLFNLGLNLLPVFIFYIVAGGSPRWQWLELPLLIVLLRDASPAAWRCCCQLALRARPRRRADLGRRACR